MSNPSPADGERRAIIGYQNQYRVAACKILEKLTRGELLWIAVADPKAGRVDDVQIGSPDRLDAYQVKWAEHGGTFTFNELVAPSDGKPCLMAQLADGWKRLGSQHPGCRIVVHLVTNCEPSTSTQARIPTGKDAPKQKHFAAFLTQGWEVARKSAVMGTVVVPPEWEAALKGLQGATRLGDGEFCRFLADCELEFGFSLPVEPEGASLREDVSYFADYQELSRTLPEIIADPKRIVRLDTHALLGRLAWRQRTEFRSRHEFPVDRTKYAPIAESVAKLGEAIDGLRTGYICVVGSPGSGKSTLLTETLRGRSERVVSYYGYVPDTQEAVSIRGESVSFLHDILIALDRRGFGVGRSFNRFDEALLCSRFFEALGLLHEDWKKTGRKTIFLVDGLDHIGREQHPQASLLRVLPLPKQIPEGVIFVLGTQTDQLEGLSSDVQAELRSAERRLEVSQLSRAEVSRIVEGFGLAKEVRGELLDEVFALSDGHPLALVLLLRELCSLDTEAEIRERLKSTERYVGDIDKIYHRYWREIEKEDAVIEAMGGIARLRNRVDLSWVASWSSAAVVTQIKRLFLHLFNLNDALFRQIP